MTNIQDMEGSAIQAGKIRKVVMRQKESRNENTKTQQIAKLEHNRIDDCAGEIFIMLVCLYENIANTR